MRGSGTPASGGEVAALRVDRTVAGFGQNPARLQRLDSHPPPGKATGRHPSDRGCGSSQLRPLSHHRDGLCPRRRRRISGDRACTHEVGHTFASHPVMAGVDLAAVRELLRHKSIDMTLRYSHLSPRHRGSAIDTLVSAFSPAEEGALQKA